jgi:hypothetical protein
MEALLGLRSDSDSDSLALASLAVPVFVALVVQELAR